jgi:hypothetical protein
MRHPKHPMLRRQATLLIRRNGSPSPLFWGPVAFLALAMIGLAALS